ncbi:MAG: HD domain-containing protein [Desulfobacterales bacterium]|nr:HD domain-containing protein [Desulfobacterales bacterium]
MKKQFMDTLSAGDLVDDLFALAEKTIARKRDGNNYMNVKLQDKTGNIKGVVWDNVDQISENVSSGDVVHVQGSVSEYKGVLQLVVKSMSPCDGGRIDPADFLPATSRDIGKMFDRLLTIIETVESEDIKNLLDAFFKDPEFVKKFKTAPAAKLMHHAYIGGLLEHTLSMSILVDKVAGHYGQVDRDLLLAGAMLHDIGKIKELEYDLQIDYSDQGRMLSHIIIGVEMINERLATIDAFPEEKACLLKHMIISHHGSREFGSPEPPKTIEAVLLNYIDEMDAKVTAIRNFMAGEDENASWTAYHRLLGRHFYMGNRKEN